jgi:hypothetical protein
MAKEEILSTTPTTSQHTGQNGRQVNKSDKNWTLHDNAITNTEVSDSDTVLIRIPKDYEKIIQTVIQFLTKREKEKEKQDYLDFCTKIKRLWDTQVNYENNKNKVKANEKGILHPSVYMWINGAKTFLTKEDMLILLEYPFNINSRHILLTLKKLKAKTLRELDPRIGIIYAWKIYKDWKTREKKLLTNYQANNNTWQNINEIKDTIYFKIELGEFDDQIEEIRQRIIKNHS